MIKIALPFPPSTNGLFADGKKSRRLSKEYDAWRHAAGWDIQIAKPGSLNGKVRVDIKLEDGRKQDLDNSAKALIDLLVTHGVIQGDSPKYVRDLRLRFDASVSGALVEVFPIPESTISPV